MSKNFYINNSANPNGGPGIFARRLQNELMNQGHSNWIASKNQISIIKGKVRSGYNNILRLDGLYFDKNHPENKIIFDCYEKFDHIIFQGEFCRDQYEAFTGIKKPHTIIPNGVNDYFFERREIEKSGAPKIVASASWRRHKRLEEVIKAFEDPKLKDVELHVLGGTSYWGSQPVPKNVNLYSFIDHTLINSFMRNCDAMIHLAWLDWCPNSVVEGLASGLPVLCSHNGGTKELVKDNGIVIQLEEDYKIGSELDLYNPPKVDHDVIVKGVLDIIEMPKDFVREDLKISSVAKRYSEVFE